MQSSIYLAIALVALCAAKQLESGPKIQKEPAPSPKSPNKRYATQEEILYLTPNEVNSLQAAKSAESKELNAENQKEQQLSVQDYNDEQQQKAWLQYFKSLESQQSREQIQDAFYSKNKLIFENRNERGDAYNFYSEQNVKEQQQRIKSQQEREREESQWIPSNPESAKKQEQVLLQGQLQQHWNIPNNNRAQLRGLSVISKELNAENQKEQQLSVRDYNDEQQQKAWLQYFKSLESEQSREQLQDAFYSKNKPIFENQNDSGDAYNFYSEQNVKEQQERIKSQQERERDESQWIPFNPESAKKQEQVLLQGQLQQHWNIPNNNRAQLRGLSVISSENQKPEASIENERPVIEWQSVSRNQEEQKSDIQKEIENIIRETSNAKKQGLASEAERYNQQRPPVLIHKEIRITKHHPVPVVERVKVSVPRPVLIPVLEPYEVKVPHPYPVPIEIVKHIPIPIIRNK